MFTPYTPIIAVIRARDQPLTLDSTQRSTPFKIKLNMLTKVPLEPKKLMYGLVNNI